MASEELIDRVDKWIAWDKNEKTNAEIATLKRSEDWVKLHSLMMGRLKFGTAGLRARMGAGNKCMNDLVVIQSAQGLLRNLEKYCKNRLSQGIVVGYDGRYNSLK